MLVCIKCRQKTSGLAIANESLVRSYSRYLGQDFGKLCHLMSLIGLISLFDSSSHFLLIVRCNYIAILFRFLDISTSLAHVTFNSPSVSLR